MRPFKWVLCLSHPPHPRPHTHTHTDWSIFTSNQAFCFSPCSEEEVLLAPSMWTSQRRRDFLHNGSLTSGFERASSLDPVLSSPALILLYPAKKERGERGEGGEQESLSSLRGLVFLSRTEKQTGEDLLWWKVKVDADPPAIFHSVCACLQHGRRLCPRQWRQKRTDPSESLWQNQPFRRPSSHGEAANCTGDSFLHFQMQYHRFRFFYFFFLRVLNVSGTIYFELFKKRLCAMYSLIFS